MIREIDAASDGIYGSPRINATLLGRRKSVSRKRDERLMRKAQITGACPGRQVRTTVRNPDDALSDYPPDPEGPGPALSGRVRNRVLS